MKRTEKQLFPISERLFPVFEKDAAQSVGGDCVKLYQFPGL